MFWLLGYACVRVEARVRRSVRVCRCVYTGVRAKEPTVWFLWIRLLITHVQ